jgi:hypothetical protein
MTLADQHLLKFHNHIPRPWSEFGSALEASGERRLKAMEMRRNEPRSELPSPFNDVVTVTVIIVWSDSYVSILKAGSPNWWPVELGVLAMGYVFKAIPKESEVQFLIDSEDITEAFNERRWEYSCVPGGGMSQEWAMMFGEQQKKNIGGEVRRFDKENDAEFLQLRMTAMWVAEETMHRAVAERDASLSSSA